ncbi:MAG: universal stress protein [Luteolibacter sp.]
MKPKKTLVAGIDFSNSSPLVLRHAVKAAQAAGAELVAVHVLDGHRIDYISSSRSEMPAADVLKKQAQEKFDRLLSGVAPGAEVQFRVETGKPAEGIARVLEETSADLLVIGANDMTKKRLGSIAAGCVRTAPCDVLVLRDWQGGEFRKIVVCDDFSTTASKAIATAAALARNQGASLKIVNVMYPPGLDNWGAVLEHRADSPLSYSDECHSRVNAKMEKSLAPHQEALAGLDYEARVLENDNSASAITSYVASEGADLVVLGTRGHSKLASYFLGTNAERLLHDLPVSVMAVR